MRNKTINIITSTLPLEHGGRTNSLLQRARILLQDSIEIESARIYTTNYNPKYDQVYSDYLKKNKINKNIQCINIYDYYREAMTKSVESIFKNYKQYLNLDTSELKKLKKKKDSNVVYYYLDGYPVFHLSYLPSFSKIRHVDIYSKHSNTSVRRLYLDENENVYKIRNFIIGTEKTYSDIYMTSDLNAYITVEYKYDKDKLCIDRIILFSSDNNHVFKTEKNFYEYWFNEVFEDKDIIINDARLLDEPLLKVNKNVKRIFQMHNPHLSDPLNANSDIKGSFSYLFNHLNEKDTIISLTTDQKKNILTKFPQLEDRIAVIPHCIENKINIEHSVIKNQACIVARLDKQKRLDHAIKAFSKVVSKNNNYKLLIYGDGDQKEFLEVLIRELGVENNIILKGRTDNVNKVYQQSECFIMSSLHEGFPLAVLESLSNGCPVISYNVLWGPNEMVNTNSGEIVENGNIESLSKAITHALSNSYDRDAVIKRSTDFSRQSFVEKWVQLIVK